MNGKILIVEDEETLCEAVRYDLECEGYTVDVAYSAEQALTMNPGQYDLILLDIMMGEISGTQFARIMKSNPTTARVPIIFCTALDSEDDMVGGLELGADDYISKPYSLRALRARIKAVLRRAAAPQSSPDVPAVETLLPGIEVNRSKRVFIVDGSELTMPRKEYEILLTLVSNRGRVYSREELMRAVWPDDVIVSDRVIDVNINRIRQKIGSYGRHIVTRSGYGYGFFD